jgi:hypothetical protein
VSIWGALAGGFAGTLVLTTALRTANELKLTRMDLPFLLGTALTADRARAKALGYALHFIFGLLFALVYYAIFIAIGRDGWWLGAIFGAVHGLFAGTALVNIMLPLHRPARTTRLPDAQLRPADAARQSARPHRLRHHRRRLHLPLRLNSPPGASNPENGQKARTTLTKTPAV